MTETKLRFGSHSVRTARNVRVPIKSSVGAESLTEGKIGNVMSLGCILSARDTRVFTCMEVGRGALDKAT